MKHVVVILFMAFSLWSCSGSVYEKYKTVPQGEWAHKDSLVIQVDVKEAGAYRLDLKMRLNDPLAYPYSNIWMKVKTLHPTGRVETAQVDLPLFSKEGYWYGTQLGNVLDRRFPQPNIDGMFPPVQLQPGTYTFIFRHDMREDVLPGISSVGLRLERQG